MSNLQTKSKRRAVLAMLAGTTLMVLSPIAHATVTWDGGGADDNWSTDANWNPTSAFQAGSAVPDDDIVFATSNVQGNTSVVDGTYLQLSTLTFQPGTPAFNLNAGSGGGVLVFNNTTTTSHVVANNSTNTMTITAGLSSANSGSIGLTINANDGDLDLSGTIFTSNPVTFQATDAARTLTASGVISGPSVVVIGSGLTGTTNLGTVVLSGANTFTGGVALNSGTLEVGDDDALGTGVLGVFGDSTITSDDDNRSIANDVAINTNQTLTVDGANDLALTGTVSGNGAITMDGSGTLALGGVNTYSGDTTVTDGTLFLNSGGSIDNSTVVLNGGTLDSDAGTTFTAENLDLQSGTVNSVISGTGPLVKTTGGTATLNAANTYTGGTAVNGGILVLGNDDALGSGGLTINDGTIQGSADDRDFDNGLTVNNGGNLTLSGTNNMAVSGIISGQGGVTKTGTNTITLNGDNTFSGGTTINNGTLALGSGTALGTGTLNVTSAGSTGSPSTLDLNGNDMGNDVTLGDTLVVNNDTGVHSLDGDISGTGGLTKTGANELDLKGTNTFSGDLDVQEGTVALFNNNAVGDDATVNLASGTTLGVTNDETIGGLTGSGSAVIATPSLVISNDQDNTFDGVISGTAGELTKEGSGTLTLTGDNTYGGGTTVNAGMLAINGSIDGDAMVNGGQLGGAGSIAGNLATAGGGVNLSGNSSFDTLSVGGDFTLASGDTLFVDLGSNSQSDQVAVTGNATLQNGSTVRLIQSENLDTTDSFTVITSSGLTDNATLDASGINGNITNADTANNLVLTLANGGPGGGGGGGGTPPPTTGGPFEQAAANSENPGIGRALDNADPSSQLRQDVGPATASSITDFANQVNQGARTSTLANNITTNVNRAFAGAQTQYLAAKRTGSPELAAASNSLLGGVSSGRPSLASAAVDPQLLRSVLTAQDARFADENQGGGDNGEFSNNADDTEMMVEGNGENGQANGFNPAMGGFVKGFGLFSDIDQSDQRTGYRADTYGLATGLDFQINRDLLVGVSFAYARTRADLDADLGNVVDNTYRLGPYVSWGRDHFFIDGSASYGYHDQSSDRNTGATGESSANFNAQDITAYVGGGYDFVLDNGLVVTPTASAQYTYYDRESYTEDGVGGLTFDDLRNNTLTSRVGGQVSYRFETNGFAIIPEVGAGWEHEYLQDDENINAQFAAGSSTFAVSTASPEEDTIYASAGVSALLGNDVSAFLQYEGNYGDEAIIHGVAGGLTFRF